MEDVLNNLHKEASAGKYKAIREACTQAKDALEAETLTPSLAPCELRETCLLPLRLALESKSNKLAAHAVTGLQKLISDARFQSDPSKDDEEHRLPLQVLQTVAASPQLNEEMQVEVMKILLTVTCSSSCSVSSLSIIKVSEFCLTSHNLGKQDILRACQITLLQIVSILAQNATLQLKQLCMECFQHSPHAGVRAISTLTMKQALGSFSHTHWDVDQSESEQETTQQDTRTETADNNIIPGSTLDPHEAFVQVLQYFCSKLNESQRASQGHHGNQNQPLLTLQLEAVLAMLSNAGPELRQSDILVRAIWQQLCPCLIAILGIPRDEKSIVSSHHPTPSAPSSSSQHPESGHTPHAGLQDQGRGSGGSATGPATGNSSARIVYSIATELVRLVGSLESMRPVLGSLFHRMLLYPPPVHRNEALKVLKEMLATPERIVDLAGPATIDRESEKGAIGKAGNKTRSTDMDLLKLLMDGISGATQSRDSAVCLSSVACVGALLSSLDEISKGKGLSEQQVELILRRAKEEQGQNGRKEKSKSGDGEVGSMEDEEGDTDIQDFRGDDSETGEEARPEEGKAATEGEEEVGISVSEEPIEEEVHIADLGYHSNLDRINAKDDSQAAVEERGLDTDKVGSNDVDGRAMEEGISGDRSQDIKDAATVEESAKQTNWKPNRDADGDLVSKMATAAANESHVLTYSQDQTGSEDAEDQSSASPPSSSSSSSPLLLPERILAERLLAERQEQKRAELERHAQQNLERERQGARDFAKALVALLPSVIPMIDEVEVDVELQKFASTFVAGHSFRKHNPDKSSEDGMTLDMTPVINADGIYVATYLGLLLNLKLIRCGHYQNPGQLPQTKNQFIESILDCGVLVYLSSAWLGELYQTLIARDLLGEAGYKAQSFHCNKALISMLTDIDGLGSQDLGGHMLHDAPSHNQKLLSLITKSTTQASEAGMAFTQDILLTLWQQLLSVLAVPLTMRSVSGVGSIALMLGTEGAKEQNIRDRDAICLSLEALRRAAALSCTLGLPARCAHLFSQIANTSCISDDPSLRAQQQQQQPQQPGGGGAGDATSSSSSSSIVGGKMSLRGWSSKGQGVRLHAAHVLSLDAILSMGLEMGSHASECWKHIFRCCAYVSQLEHCHFSSSNQPTIALPKVTDSTQTLPGSAPDNLDLSLPSYVPVQSAAAPTFDVSEVIGKEMAKDVGFEVGSARGGMLSATTAAKVVCGLSSEVDRFFDEAANNLNLGALLAFLRELRTSSRHQLYQSTPQQTEKRLIAPTSPSKSLNISGQASTSLLLFRMCDVILRCTRHRTRPLLHLMQAWSVVAPHLVEAACHRDRHVSKQAITAIHDVLTELLYAKTEHPHFNFHEALLKPFESLLCLELCDEDVQDQVVTSICEVVEASFANIKSGWRPLFGALRAVRITLKQPPAASPEEEMADRTEHPLAPLFNVFEAFLNTDNVTVFANAAVDCILCLLKFLRGSGYSSSSQTSTPSSSLAASPERQPKTLDLCFPALNYLHRCHKILASIYTMPACPIFRGAQSIKLGSPEGPPDNPATPTLPGVGGAGGGSGQQRFRWASGSKEDEYLFEPVTAEQVDDATGLGRVWYLLLEGLTGAVSTCPRGYQPQTLELLFELLRSVLSVPGPQFALFAVSELLLPMLHSWVHRSRQFAFLWEATVANFKHACGLSTDLVVEYVVHFVRTGMPLTGLYLTLRQMLDVLIECIGQPNESVSRLGCSCIRHLLLSAGPSFTHDMWTVACLAMQRAIAMSLRNLKLLMSCFHPGSDDFMGDVCQVKVAARKDVSELEYLRLQQLAQQVFLLESQRTGMVDVDSDSNRSFIFIIYPPEMDLNTSIDQIRSRVSFRGLVLGLLAHQLLIQTLGTIFLYGVENQTTKEQNMIAVPSSVPPQRMSQGGRDQDSEMTDTSLPGLLAYLSPKNLGLLLECFVQSYQMACDFNTRPGLKFLLQKVAKFEVAVNLYWQAGVSFTFYLHTLLELCHHASGERLTQDRVKDLVRQHVTADGRPLSPNLSSPKPAVKRVNFECSAENGQVGQGLNRERSDTENSHGSNASKDSSIQLQCDLTFYPTSNASNPDWIVRRLHGICNDVCASYIQMYLDLNGGKMDASRINDQPLFFLVAPKSPEVASKPSEFFGFDEGENCLNEDENDDREMENSVSPKEKSPKFAAHWTPKIKGLDPEEESVVDVMEEYPKKPATSKKKAESVYTVASRKTIKSLMQEYKKRKTQHSRSVFVKKPTYKELKYTRMLEQRQGVGTAPATPEERVRQQQIKDEQKTSIVRDGEAEISTWSDMVHTMLQLLQLLSDSHFQALLPAVFPGINQLVRHVADDRVRQAVMEFMDRVAHLYQIL
ncbi:brefeldin A-inhibited guanine nucleotide-exchange protein 3-like isoform X3 [Acanthaster planci]|uniref:Brefeldin A-inhibited guanine nucleotide-exchange protein 3-like isoform X3 n=1 Tax=Acanthaster planci TaxID=133434 RepID=A0A8B7YDZ0_ACAPL|nr:brefeldin A-inhibited guanine nucleotide-exchange protein 3-like isoform X3 [Acanthaster planci]